MMFLTWKNYGIGHETVLSSLEESRPTKEIVEELLPELSGKYAHGVLTLRDNAGGLPVVASEWLEGNLSEECYRIVVRFYNQRHPEILYTQTVYGSREGIGNWFKRCQQHHFLARDVEVLNL